MPNPFAGPRALSKSNLNFGRNGEITELRHRLISQRLVLRHSQSSARNSLKISVIRTPVPARSRWTNATAPPSTPKTRPPEETPVCPRTHPKTKRRHTRNHHRTVAAKVDHSPKFSHNPLPINNLQLTNPAHSLTTCDNERIRACSAPHRTGPFDIRHPRPCPHPSKWWK